MPYKSDAMRKWAHTKSGKKALVEERVKEYDEKSKGKKLPEKVKKKR